MGACSLYNPNKDLMTLSTLAAKSVELSTDIAAFKDNLKKLVELTYTIDEELLKGLDKVLETRCRFDVKFKKFFSINGNSRDDVLLTAKDAISGIFLIKPPEKEVYINTNDLNDKDDAGDPLPTIPEDLSQLFGGYLSLYAAFKKQFKAEVNRHTIADLEKRLIVLTDLQLNLQINALKNLYYQRLLKYIRQVSDINIGEEQLFDAFGNIAKNAQSNLDLLLKVALTYFASEKTIDDINIARMDPNNVDLINAFFAFNILRNNNFDKLLKEFREDLTAHKRLGFFTNASQLKYSLFSLKLVQKGLGTDRAAHSSERASKKARSFVESFSVDTLLGTRYLEYNLVVQTISKITDIRHYTSASNADFKLISNIHNLGVEGAAEIFARILGKGNSKLNEKIHINDFEYKLIEVLYENIYNINNRNSLMAIHASQMRVNPVHTYTMLDDIHSMLFGQNQRTYVTFSKNGDEVYNRNYTVNTALRYSDLFNFSLNDLLYIQSAIHLNKLDFAIRDEKSGMPTHTYVSANIDIDTDLGPVNSKILFGKDGDFLINGQSFAEAILGKSKGSKKYPLTMDQIQLYVKNGYLESNATLALKNYIKYLNFISNLIPGIDLLGKDFGVLYSLYVHDPTDYMQTLNKLVYDISLTMLINYDLLTSKDDMSLSDRLATKYNRVVSSSYGSYTSLINQSSGGLDVNGNKKVSDPIGKLAEAIETLNGNVSGTIKNSMDTTMPVNLNLIESLKIHSHVEELGNVFSTNILKLGDNMRLVSKGMVHIDETSYHGESKMTKHLTESELNHSMFYNRFLSGLTDRNPYIYTQPTVYADKGMLDIHKIFLKGWKYNGETYDFSTEKLPVIQSVFFESVGETYKEIYAQVLSDYRTVIKEHVNFFAERLRQVDIDVDEKTQLMVSLTGENNAQFLKLKSNVAEIIQKLQQQADVLASVTGAVSQEIQQQLNYYKDFLQNLHPAQALTFDQCALLMGIITPTEYENMSWESKVGNILELHISGKTLFTIVNEAGQETTLTGCGINWLLLYSGEKLYKDKKIFSKMLQREKAKYLLDLYKSDVHFHTIHSDNKKNVALHKALEKYKLLDDWVMCGEMVLAKDALGNPIHDFEELPKDFQMNPLLERYFLVDLLFRTSLRHMTVGTELGHANGYGKIIYNEDGTINEEKTAEMMASARNTSSYKRHTAETLPRVTLNLNSIVTLPKTLKVSVMSDMVASVQNVNGESAYIKAQDGGSNLNPLIGILINKGLGGNEAGEDLKGLLRGMNDRYGQAILYKYASFSQYNERMRNSINSTVNMLHIFKKQTSLSWNSLNDKPEHVKYSKVNITKNLYGTSMDFSEIVEGKPYFFKRGRKIYRLHNITEGALEDEYNIHVEEVKFAPNGKPVYGRTAKNTFAITTHIESIWELFNALGGVFSGHFANNTFVYDDSSLHAVVGYMNNVGIAFNKLGAQLQKKENAEYLTSDMVYQPLKEHIIASCLNLTGCKSGANHVNPIEAWTNDEELHYMEVPASAWGLVQDYDHDMSEGEAIMTEFSLVITALSAGGAMFTRNARVFKSITGYSLQLISQYTAAVKKFMDEKLTQQGKSEIYELITNLLIRGSKNSKSMSERIVKDILKIFLNNLKSGNTNHYNDEQYMPLSNPEIFVHYITQIAAVINSLSVKRKVSGYGGVMAPSYNMFMYFDIPKLESVGLHVPGKATYTDILASIYKSTLTLNDTSTIYFIDERVKAKISTSKSEYQTILQRLIVQDGVLTNVDLDGVYINRDMQLKNLLSYITDLQINDQFKVGNSSILSDILENIHNTFNGVLKQEFDSSTGVYTYTKIGDISDDTIVLNYLSILSQWSTSNVIHKQELDDMREKGIENLPSQPMPGTLFKYEYVNVNLKSIDELFIQDSIILANADGSIQTEEVIDETTNQKITRPKRITVDSYETYIKLKNNDENYFYVDITLPKNLQPSKLRFKGVNGKWYDIYDVPQIREIFKERASKKADLEMLLRHRKITIPMFQKIDQGWVPVTLEDYDAVTVPEDKMEFNGGYYIRYVDKVESHAECVIPKIFATLFGLLEGDSLYEILQEGAEFFNRRAKELYSSINLGSNWDLAYVNNTGEHRYIKFTMGNSNRLEVDPRYIEIHKKLVKTDDGEKTILYKNRVDDNGDVMYTLQTAEQVEGEEALWKDYIIPLESADGDELLCATSAEAASSLYDADEYKGIKARHNNQLLGKVKDVVKLLDKDKITILLPYEGKTLYETLDMIEDSEQMVKLIDHYNITKRRANAVKVFNSFKLSLELLTARIPAQSLQSFMKMQVVGFTESNKNSIMVSHYLLWLQGSDFDIDKAYSMGYEFTKDGLFVGWSPYFNLNSLSNYTQSLELPLPTGIKISYLDPNQADSKKLRLALDITNLLQNPNVQSFILNLPGYFDSTSIDGNPSSLEVITHILNVIGDAKYITYDSNKVPSTYKDGVKWLVDVVNKHNDYFSNAYKKKSKSKFKPNAKLVAKAYKNCTTYNALKIASGLPNVPDSTSPISMSVVGEAAAESPLGKESYYVTQYTPSTVAKMTSTFMAGKDGIGVAANGEKVFFSLLYYYTDVLLSGNIEDIRRVIFNKLFVLGTSTFTRNLIANINLNYILGISPDLLISKKELVRNLIVAMYKGQYSASNQEQFVKDVMDLLEVQHDQALVISALLSAATDNAKELILSKINADPLFMNMYLYCIMLGIPFKNVAEFMTNPIIGETIRMSKTNIHDEFAPIKETSFKRLSFCANIINKGAYNLMPHHMKLLISKEEYDKLFTSMKLLPVTYKQIHENDNISTSVKIKCKRFIDLHNRLLVCRLKIKDEQFVPNPKSKLSEEELFSKYVSSIIELFEDINKGGLEITNLAVLLSLNLGLPVTLEDSINKYVKIEQIFMNAVKFNKRKELENRELEAYIKENKIETEFSLRKFMINDTYRKAAIALYETAKHTVNIFEVIVKIPHIWSLYEMWHTSEVGKSAATAKYDKIIHLKEQLGGKNLTSSEVKSLSSVVHDTALYNWIVRLNIKIPISKGLLYYSNKKLEVADLDFILTIDSHDALATFKMWFESEAFTNLLKRGTLTKDSPANVELLQNAFVRNIVKSAYNNSYSGKRVPIITFNTDFKLIGSLGHSQDIFNTVTEDFQKLKDYTYYGRTYIDWFFLYNLVANKNMYGPLRILPMFANIKEKSELMDIYDRQTGEDDMYNRDTIGHISVDDILKKIAPVVTKKQAESKEHKYIRLWSSDLQCYKLYKRNDERKYVSSELQEAELAVNDLINDVQSLINEVFGQFRIANNDYIAGYTEVEVLGDPSINAHYTFTNLETSHTLSKYRLNQSDEGSLKSALYNLLNDNIITVYIKC